jgi:Na+-driven multidrug efflux pump
MFQAMGNTWPPLASSAMRLLIFALPALILSRQPGFTIREAWYLSVTTVALQAVVNLLLLRREFVRKLNFAAQPAHPQATGVSAS